MKWPWTTISEQARELQALKDSNKEFQSQRYDLGFELRVSRDTAETAWKLNEILESRADALEKQVARLKDLETGVIVGRGAAPGSMLIGGYFDPKDGYEAFLKNVGAEMTASGCVQVFQADQPVMGGDTLPGKAPVMFRFNVQQPQGKLDLRPFTTAQGLLGLKK